MQITQPWRLLGNTTLLVLGSLLESQNIQTHQNGRGVEDGSKLGRTWTSTFSSEAKRLLAYFSISFLVFTLVEMSPLSTGVNAPETSKQELHGLGRNTPSKHLPLHSTFNSKSRTAHLVTADPWSPLHHPQSVKRPHFKCSFHTH